MFPLSRLALQESDVPSSSPPRRIHRRRRWAAIVCAAAVALAPLTAASSAAAAQTEVAVTHTQTTTVQGTPNLTYFTCPPGMKWDRYSSVSWGPAGCALEVAFTGHSVELYGSTRSGHGTGTVYVDGVEIGRVNYGAATNNTVRRLFQHEGLEDVAHTLRVVVAGNGINHASARFVSGASAQSDGLSELYRSVEAFVEADYSAGSWPGFAAARGTAAALAAEGSGTPAEREAARASLKTSADALVMIRGLRDLIDDYDQRVPSDFTPATWTEFAAARTAAAAVLDDPDVTVQSIVTAKNTLQDTAAALEQIGEGEFLPITNNTFWRDTAGNPIYSQGGGIFQFGDTYYWYGVNYRGAALYAANPTRLYNNDVAFVSIPVYTSKDLVNWTFANEVAEASTPLHIPAAVGRGFSQMTTLADAAWLGRMGVAYNENTGKYVLLIQIGQDKFPDPDGGSGVLFLQGDSPTDDFSFGNIQRNIQNSPTASTGDQTIFTDEDGTDYLVFSNSSGRSRAFVSRLAPSDSLSLEPGVQIGYVPGGREGNAMFRLKDRYYMAASALHGWNTSPNYVIASKTDQIQGEYGQEFVLPGSERDYSHVTQTGFFVTIHGTERDTVLYAGDRWADFAWNGNGYNQWLPIDDTGAGLQMHSLSAWELNAVTGEWRVAPGNNYALNPEFAADRIIVASLTGWENRVDGDSQASSLVSNISPGAGGTRFAAKLGAAEPFSGGMSQRVEVPDGVYRFALSASSTGGFEWARAVVTGAEGEREEIDLTQATAGWERREIPAIAISGGHATITLEARGSGGQSLRLDALSLVRQKIDTDALTAAIETASTKQSDAHSRRTWSPFADALAAAVEVAGSDSSTQAEVDVAAEALSKATSALESALTGMTATLLTPAVALGTQVKPADAQLLADFADGSTRTLHADEYVMDVDTTVEGEREVSFTALEDLRAVGAPPLRLSAVIQVAPAWDANRTYVAPARVVDATALWEASWWTSNQKPGDPYGPWQEIRQLPDGEAVWTPSRIFSGGEIVSHEGVRYQAKWWTRNQSPGDVNGPWSPIE